ncbi:MAG: chromosomal replication initiator protein DnaA [Cytophagales bacterium]|nr:MAG: chromosomal replication initiator protein DnaA [Cytophagales bacterium]
MLIVKNCKSVWNNCLQLIAEVVGEQSFKTWFEPIVPLSLTNEVLTIQVPSKFFYEWLEEHYVGVLRIAIDKELGTQGRLEYLIDQEKNNESSRNSTNLSSGMKGSIALSSGIKTTSGAENSYKGPFEQKNIDKGVYLDSNLNPNYQFDNFVEGDCNRLARSAGIAITKNPGTSSFNPLMLYSSVGLGKTHLVQSIGNAIKEKHKDKTVVYVSSEKFTSQFIEASYNNRIQEFANFYMQVDVLIIDDVQFLAGKEKTQEVFFTIFNHLHQNKKQVVMTSDCAPKDLKGMQERLISRFKWGLTADLQQPDLETRKSIIYKKLQKENIAIDENVIDYIAYSVDTNIRELEGVIVSLIGQSVLNQKEIDLELAKQTLQNIVRNIESEVNIDYIQKFVSDYFHVTIELLKDKTRKREIVVARQVSMYFAKEFTNMSLKSIGANFGNRDHSTVIHAITAVNDMMDTDRKFKAMMEELIKKFKMKSI